MEVLIQVTTVLLQFPFKMRGLLQVYYCLLQFITVYYSLLQFTTGLLQLDEGLPRYLVLFSYQTILTTRTGFLLLLLLHSSIPIFIFFITIFPPHYYTVLYCTILYYTILYYTVLYCTVLYSRTEFCHNHHFPLSPFSHPTTILYCTVLYYTILYCTILYYTALHCTIPHCTVQ